MSEPESLATREGFDVHLDRHHLDRMVMLSDGIFAIATTLAALDIRVPAHAGSLAELLGRVDLSLAAYAISFLVIAVFWVSNRDLFARLVRVDRIITILTLATLCLVAIIPACAHAIYSHGNTEAAFRFYGSVMAGCGLLNTVTWAYAGLLRPGLMRTEVTRMHRWRRVIVSATMPILFGTLAVLPDARSLPVLVPLGVGMALLRRVVLPRMFRSLEAQAGTP